MIRPQLAALRALVTRRTPRHAIILTNPGVDGFMQTHMRVRWMSHVNFWSKCK